MNVLESTPDTVTDTFMLELAVAETALPAHMLYLMACTLHTEKVTLRRDIIDNLNNAGLAAFRSLQGKDESVKRVAARVDRGAQRILHVLAPDRAVHGFHCAAMFCLKLVEEGLLADADNMAVLTSLAILTDLREEGGVDNYSYRETLLAAEARKMLDAARHEGFYRMAQPRRPGFLQ